MMILFFLYFLSQVTFGHIKHCSCAGNGPSPMRDTSSLSPLEYEFLSHLVINGTRAKGLKVQNGKLVFQDSSFNIYEYDPSIRTKSILANIPFESFNFNLSGKYISAHEPLLFDSVSQRITRYSYQPIIPLASDSNQFLTLRTSQTGSSGQTTLRIQKWNYEGIPLSSCGLKTKGMFNDEWNFTAHHSMKELTILKNTRTAFRTTTQPITLNVDDCQVTSADSFDLALDNRPGNYFVWKTFEKCETYDLEDATAVYYLPQAKQVLLQKQGHLLFFDPNTGNLKKVFLNLTQRISKDDITPDDNENLIFVRLPPSRGNPKTVFLKVVVPKFN